MRKNEIMENKKNNIRLDMQDLQDSSYTFSPVI